MDNYIKDKVVEVMDDTVVFGDSCPPDVHQLRVGSATNPKNIVDYSMRHLTAEDLGPKSRQIVLTASDKSCHKAITCAELLKRKFNHKMRTHLYQMTRIGQKTVEEYWKPREDIGLDALKVVRKIPRIDILLSVDALDTNASGVQHKDINVFNQSTDKNRFNRHSNKAKQHRNKPKNYRKPTNESMDTTNEAKRS